MYKFLVRPILFQIDPEKVHHLIVKSLKLAFKIPGIPFLLKSAYKKENELLRTTVAGLVFKNPVGLAPGFDKNAEFFDEFSSFGFGHIEIGTVTPKPQPGNDKPRIFRLPKDNAIINRMGFNNKGVRNIAKNLENRRNDLIIGGNIGKNTKTSNEEAVNDYVYTCKVLYNDVDYFVINVSCPNISNLSKLQDQDSLDEILKKVVAVRKDNDIYKPIFLKISPDLNYKQVDATLELVKKHQIDGIVLTNTTIQRNKLITEKNKIENIGNGGLSGLPIRDRSTEMIKYVHEKTNGELAIIGVGGIMTAEDAMEKINAGASLVQVYTGFIYEGPGIVKKINKKILQKRKEELEM